MATNVLQEFLIAIGFQFDQSGLRRIQRNINKAAEDTGSVVKKLTLSVASAAITMETALVAASVGLAKLGAEMSRAYYASQRMGSSVSSVNAFTYAASQLGSSVEAAQRSLENLGSLRRSNPQAYVGILRQMGVNARDARGNLISAADAATKLEEAFRKAPSYQVGLMRAESLGFDENTYRAMRDGQFGRFQRQHDVDQSRLGYDPDKAAEDGRRYSQVWNRLMDDVQMLSTKVGAAFFNQMGGMVNKATEWLVENGERISNVAIRVGNFVLHFAETAGKLADQFIKATPVTQDFIGKMGLLAAALLALNMGPVGAIFAVGSAVLALLDDYNKWKEGAPHLIDWDKWAPAIEKAISAMGQMWDKFDELSKKLTGQDGLTTAFEAFGVVLALKVLSPLSTIVSSLAALSSWKVPVWLLRLLGVSAVVAAGAMAESTPGAGVSADKTTRDQQREENERLTDAWNKSHGQTGNFLTDTWNWAKGKLGFGGGGGDGYSGKASTGRAHVGTTAQQQAAAKESFDFWKSKGLNDNAALGMVAQEDAESKFDPNSEGDGGAAKGLFQHHADRRRDIYQGSGVKMGEDSHLRQLEGMYWEFTKGHDSQTREAWKALLNAKSIDEAAYIGVHGVERPADQVGQTRARTGIGYAWKDRFDNMRRAQETRERAANNGSKTGSEPRLPPGAMYWATDSRGNRVAVNAKGESVNSFGSLAKVGPSSTPAHSPYGSLGAPVSSSSSSTSNTSNDNSRHVTQYNTIQGVNDPDAVVRSFGEFARRGFQDRVRVGQGSTQ